MTVALWKASFKVFINFMEKRNMKRKASEKEIVLR